MPENPLGTVEQTARGFEIIKFNDQYGCPCSLQQSSIWLDDNRPGASCVWLGISDSEPKIMASQAATHGVQTSETTGWVPYPIPEDVLISTRMHLDRKQAKALIKALRVWIKTGYLSEEK